MNCIELVMVWHHHLTLLNIRKDGQEMFSENMENFKISQILYFLSDSHQFCFFFCLEYVFISFFYPDFISNKQTLNSNMVAKQRLGIFILRQWRASTDWQRTSVFRSSLYHHTSMVRSRPNPCTLRKKVSYLHGGESILVFINRKGYLWNHRLHYM